MTNEMPCHRFKIGQAIPEAVEWGGSLTTGELALAVAVRMTNGRVNYFLTLGKPFHEKRLADIAKRVLERSGSFSLDGTPDEAEICHSLCDAANEPYFYEQYLSLVMTMASIHSDADRKRIREELESGEHFYFLGSSDQRKKIAKEVLVDEIVRNHL